MRKYHIMIQEDVLIDNVTHMWFVDVFKDKPIDWVGTYHKVRGVIGMSKENFKSTVKKYNGMFYENTHAIFPTEEEAHKFADDIIVPVITIQRFVRE